MINSHIHIFRDSDVPSGFLPLGLVKALQSKVGFFLLKNLLTNINPFSNKDAFDRYVKFVEISRLGGQKEILNECRRFYPSGTSFVPLAMDMSYMGCGLPKRGYWEQLMELAEVADRIPGVYPFIMLDPRRGNLNKYFDYFVKERHFKGVKIYPSLGYFPQDKRLYSYYEYCQANNIPITAHCSPANPVHYKGPERELDEMIREYLPNIGLNNMTRKEKCALFTNPKNWEKVLTDFPKLKVNLAHWGSYVEWDRWMSNPSDDNWYGIIYDMLKKWPTLYTDISFTMCKSVYFAMLKVALADEVICSKVLFGSDFYMVEAETTERQFGVELRAYLGEDLFKQISLKNPVKFLGIGN